MGIFKWWYGEGWLKHLRASWLGILRTADFFSIGLLIKTLFSPFRQISAGQVSGALPVRLSAFFDRLLSRTIGGVMRSFLVIVGTVVILLRAVWTVISMAFWTLLPTTPIIGLILWQMGVGIL